MSFPTKTPENFPDGVPNDLIRQSISSPRLLERIAAQNRLWFWALFNQQEYLSELKKLRESNEFLAQQIQKQALVLTAWKEIDAREQHS